MVTSGAEPRHGQRNWAPPRCGRTCSVTRGSCHPGRRSRSPGHGRALPRHSALVSARLPAHAVVITVWQSGSMRFHAGRDAVLWDSLDPRGSIAQWPGSPSTAARRTSWSNAAKKRGFATASAATPRLARSTGQRVQHCGSGPPVRPGRSGALSCGGGLRDGECQTEGADCRVALTIVGRPIGRLFGDWRIRDSAIRFGDLAIGRLSIDNAHSAHLGLP